MLEVLGDGKRRQRYRLQDYPHALREVGLAGGLGAALEAGHQRRDARTTSATAERYRMRPENAGRQEEAAGTMPLPVVKPCAGDRDVTVPVSALVGGGGGSSTDVSDLGDTLLRFHLDCTPKMRHEVKGPNTLNGERNGFGPTSVQP